MSAARTRPLQQQPLLPVQTHLDQVDAETVADEWLRGMLPTDRSIAFWQHERFSFSPHNGRGMGLTFKGAPMHLRDEIFVRCLCGHTGPGVEVPTIGESSTWPVSVAERDRLALKLWNDAAQFRTPERNAAAAQRSWTSSHAAGIPSARLSGVNLPSMHDKLRQGIVIRTNFVEGATEIEGKVDGRHVILLSDAGKGDWHVASSASLPVEIDRAIQYAQCMQQAFDRARERGMDIA